MDLKSGYWQVPIKKSDQVKTSFQWGNQCYKFCRLPFGYTFAGNIFSRCVAQMLDTVKLRSHVSNYIDDVVHYAKTFTDYRASLRQVFAAMRTFGIKLKPSKCSFLQSSTRFLGRVVDATGIKQDPEYTEALRKMPAPTNMRELQSLIGSLTWIRSFIETRVGEKVADNLFAHLMHPLHDLRKVSPSDKRPTFRWTKEADDAFTLMKTRLASPATISFPDYSENFILHTDASQWACGGVLTQVIKGKTRIVAAVSHTFSKAEVRWSTSEKECYGILWTVERLEKMLKGRSFVLYTDHKSLTYLDKTHFKNPKIARWQTRLSEFDFTLQYVPGVDNVFADTISRPNGHRPAVDDGPIENAGQFLKFGNSKLVVYIPSWCSDAVPKSATKVVAVHTAKILRPIDNPDVSPRLAALALEQRDDHFLDTVISAVTRATDTKKRLDLKTVIDRDDHRRAPFIKIASKLFISPTTHTLMYRHTHGSKIVVPCSLKGRYLHRAHDLSAHCGIPRMKDGLRDLWWPAMDRDVENYARSCVTCLRRKGDHGRSQKPLPGQVRRGSRPGQILCIDYVHMPNCGGKKYLLTCIDTFSRYLWAIPTTKDNAISTAKALVRHVFLNFDFIPEAIHSDRGTHFINQVVTELCRLNNIEHSISTAFHPESNGMVERSHRTLKNGLFAMGNSEGINWLDALPWVLRGMNGATNKQTNIQPRAAWFGERSKFVSDVDGAPTASSPAIFGNDVKNMVAKVASLIKVASDAADAELERKRNRMPSPSELYVGQLVYIKRPVYAKAKVSKETWVGPLRVVNTNGQVVLIKDKVGRTDWVHRSHVVPAEQRHPDIDFVHQDEEMFIWSHLTDLVEGRSPNSVPDHLSSGGGNASSRMNDNPERMRCPKPASSSNKSTCTANKSSSDNRKKPSKNPASTSHPVPPSLSTLPTSSTDARPSSLIPTSSYKTPGPSSTKSTVDTSTTRPPTRSTSGGVPTSPNMSLDSSFCSAKSSLGDPMDISTISGESEPTGQSGRSSTSQPTKSTARHDSSEKAHENRIDGEDVTGRGQKRRMSREAVHPSPSSTPKRNRSMVDRLQIKPRKKTYTK